MRLLIPLLFLFSFSSAHAALFADNEAREEIIKLRKYVKEEQDQRISDLQARLAASERSRQTLEKRLADMESAEKSRTVELLSQLDRLTAEIANLRGQVEVSSYQVEQTQQRQRDLYADVDGRLRKVEGGPSTTGANVSSAAVISTAPAADSAAELQSYEAAHEMFKAGKYKESAAAFEDLLAKYPNGKYAPNAQYWLGYAQFSQKNYKASMASQQRLIQAYPDHSKVPDAMYNIANCQIQLADIAGAKQTLRDLLAKHPDSEVAPLAKKRLAVLDSVKTP
jgi:tol-pal system protein YbgF